MKKKFNWIRCLGRLITYKSITFFTVVYYFMFNYILRNYCIKIIYLWILFLVRMSSSIISSDKCSGTSWPSSNNNVCWYWTILYSLFCTNFPSCVLGKDFIVRTHKRRHLKLYGESTLENFSMMSVKKIIFKLQKNSAFLFSLKVCNARW